MDQESEPKRRPGTFAPGYDPRRSLPNRRQGTHNRIGIQIKKGIFAAAKAHGSDGKGKNGLDGYFEFLAAKHPKIFSTLLGRLMPLHVSVDDTTSGPIGTYVESVTIVGVPSGTFLSREEISEIERREMEMPLIEHAIDNDDELPPQAA